MTPGEVLGELRPNKIGDVAEIRAVIIRELHWTLNELPISPNQTVELNVAFNIGHGNQNENLRYELIAEISGHIPSGELFRMLSKHNAFFQIPSNSEYSDEDLAEFGKVSVFMMLYPYVRETLQTQTTSAGLPPVILAPLKIQVTNQSEAVIEP